MCGAIGRAIDNPFVRSLMDLLNIDFDTQTDYNVRPNARLPISIGKNRVPTGVEASWWLFQTRAANGYTYDKRYKSFNTRKEKLFTHRRKDFANQRCIIPASCFYEWKGNRYRVEPVDDAIAFGGVYHKWPTDTGTPHYSCSIITLPPHPRFCHIHDKSLPLMLLPDEIEPWLDDTFHAPNYWLPTLESRIRFDLKVTPVDKKDPSLAIRDSEIIRAD
ncbi:MAG: SOS response-associated peptidase [Kangiellaceae bacterium]|nr:SOS response-associated peptidase [Kangiellaceae bacterium]MCW9000600.1 SOS response-associated peptidase [Kangiellaceae bacterium]MCW9016847.1 SOS response-associated peptidase [Kangiellaceae bacterium]